MKRLFLFILLNCISVICFSGEETNLVQNDSAVISGRDFYFANLAYKDFIEDNMIKQEKAGLEEYLNYFEELSKRENWNPFEEMDKGEWGPERRQEILDYIKLQEYLSDSREDFIRHNFLDFYEYKFVVTYKEEIVEVYMFIDRPSVRGGDAEYVFDYDGNIISKRYGK
jgi:hypothetical protein